MASSPNQLERLSPKSRVVLFFLLTTWLVFIASCSLLQRGFWLDEAMTAWVSQQSPLTILAWSAQKDIALPLPYLLYWGGGSLFGYSELSLRLLSILLTALTLTVLFAVFQPINKKWAWIIASLAVLPTVHWMGGEVRYYAALTLACTLSHFASARFINNKGMSRLGIVAAWTLPPLMHPLGSVVTLFNMLVTGIYLFRQRRLRHSLVSFIGAGVAILALLLPFVLDDARRKTFWPGTLDLAVVFREMAGFLVSGRYLGDPWLPVVLIGVVSLAALFGVRSPITLLGLATLWGGWGILLLTIAVKPVFQVRYTLPLLSSWIIIVISLLVIPSAQTAKRWWGLAVFFLAFAGMVWFGRLADDYPDRDVQLREAAAWIQERAAEDDLIIGWPPDITNAVAYYLPNLTVTNWGPDGIWSLDNIANFSETWSKVPSGTHRLWLLDMTYYADHDPAQTLQTVLELSGANVVKTAQFDFVTVKQIELPKERPSPHTFNLTTTLSAGPQLEQVAVLDDTWCVNQQQPVYLFWRRLPQQEPSSKLRVSVRLTPAETDLTPLTQNDGAPVPEYGKVTYFPSWWPANQQKAGRFHLTPATTGGQWLVVVAYLADGGTATVLDEWPITHITVESCE